MHSASHGFGRLDGSGVDELEVRTLRQRHTVDVQLLARAVLYRSELEHQRCSPLRSESILDHRDVGEQALIRDIPPRGG